MHSLHYILYQKLCCQVTIAGCMVNSVSGPISLSEKTVTTTFSLDNPSALFDCGIHRKPFKDCKYPYIV